MPLKQPTQEWEAFPHSIPPNLGVLSVLGLRGSRKPLFLMHGEPFLSCVILGVFEFTKPMSYPWGPIRGLPSLVSSTSSSQVACEAGCSGILCSGVCMCVCACVHVRACADEVRRREIWPKEDRCWEALPGTGSGLTSKPSLRVLWEAFPTQTLPSLESPGSLCVARGSGGPQSPATGLIGLSGHLMAPACCMLTSGNCTEISITAVQIAGVAGQTEKPHQARNDF